MPTSASSRPLATLHGTPLLGHSPQMLLRPLPFLQSLRSRGPVVVVRLGTKPLYVINDHELILEMLLKQVRNFDKGRQHEKVRSWLGNGLITSGGDAHLRQRRLVQQAELRRQVAVHGAFAFDDEYCDEGPLSSQSAPFIHALAHSGKASGRIAAGLPHGRDVESVALHPDLNDYVVLRMVGGGAQMFGTLPYMVSQAAVTEAEWADRRVILPHEASCYLAGADSDFFAYVKERVRSEDCKGHNLVHTIERDRGCSIDEAIEAGMGIRNRVMGLNLKVREAVLQDASDGLRDMIHGFDGYISGALAGYFENIR